MASPNATLLLAATLAGGILFATTMTQAHATIFNYPPAAGAILDLNGQAAPTNITTFSVNFTASDSSTAISFAFRDDSGDIFFSNPSLKDVTASSGNLLTNASFSSTYTSNSHSIPTGWTYLNFYNATYGGNVSGNAWKDGAAGAYDSLTQTVSTTAGDSYSLAFSAYVSNASASFSRLSTNGHTGISGNGLDIVAYARAVPGPPSLPLFGAGLLGLAYLRRRDLFGKA